MKLFDVDCFAFLFDVDGTLIDIASTPQAVRVPPSLTQHLARLTVLTNGAVALVSGRALTDLERLFPQPDLSLVGGHGAESRIWCAGRAEHETALPIDGGIRQQLLALRNESSKIIVEDKGYSIAVHYRMAPQLERTVDEAVTSIAASGSACPLVVLRGKAVVEVRAAGIDKGTGVRRVMQCAPFAGRRPVYVGDDVTDEDAFAVMPEFDGIAISVGRAAEGAVRGFETPDDVRRWLGQLCETRERPKPV